ncbi:hypothetical protein HIO71_17145 [Chryseobacterium aquaticum]|uniref:Uncharacterized protein n=1 Tax=Chryseobacterium aquaticum TaxID=452084 RepID=A0A848N3Y8_9FLAO|nr:MULTISPECIES: hypothetical protein [Chryseobacterium]NMR35907.1 hypothetical protein [Chryseobacterium aquaticum]NRQ47982.1 hypothetical protein [Chryseobacterium sp. C-204]
MKNKLMLRLCLMVIALLSLNSCRQEDLYEQGAKPQGKDQYKVYMMNRKQITSDFALFDKVARIQSVFTERKNLNARSIQDSVLDGGVVKIDKVLVVENEGGQKTYTFPLKRTFPTSTIENLVLKRNTDSTFSGVLVQYHLSSRDKDLFNKWHSVDLKSKTKIYDINNLSIATSAKIITTSFGCFTMSYEDGMCGEGLHPYGDTSCTFTPTNQPTKQAQPPRILFIKAIPSCGGDGSVASNPNPATGSVPNGGGEALTMMFDEYDLTYHNGDITDPDFQFWYKVNQFVQAQPQNVQSLNAEHQYVFYFIHSYFKLNGGLTNANKIFVANRLQQLAAWLYDTSMGTHLDYNQKLNVGIWSVKYLMENPDVTWDDFKNQYLTSPCEKVKTATNTVTGLKDKLVSLNTPANLNLTYEKGATITDDAQGNITMTTKDGSPGNTFIQFEVPATGEMIVYLHTHFNGTNMMPVFTFEDLMTFASMYQYRVYNHKPVTKLTMYVISPSGVFAMVIEDLAKFDTDAYRVWGEERDFLEAEYYADLKKNPTNTIENVIKEISKSLPKFGIGLYKANANLTGWSRLTYDPNTNQTTAVPCN